MITKFTFSVTRLVKTSFNNALSSGLVTGLINYSTTIIIFIVNMVIMLIMGIMVSTVIIVIVVLNVIMIFNVILVISVIMNNVFFDRRMEGWLDGRVKVSVVLGRV
jgi:hypothetical protein